MAAAANFSLVGGVIGGLTGAHTVALTVTSAAANGQVQQIVLQSGANTITVPSSPAPSGVIIVLPTTNTAETTLKGLTGDTGIDIGKTGWAVLPFNTASLPASFVLTSAATQTGLITEITFF